MPECSPLSAFAPAVSLCLPGVANAQMDNVEARLQDGSRVNLKSDGTYSRVESTRGLTVKLRSLGAPSSFMSDPRRDCGMVFEVQNNLGGRLLSFHAPLTIHDKAGNEVLNSGVMQYDIDLFGFGEADLSDGLSRTVTVDVELACSEFKSVSIQSVDEKYCNYVGRLPDDKCRDLISVESHAPEVEFRR